MGVLKEIIWKGGTLADVRRYPKAVKQEIGFELNNIQKGETPSDYKSMKSVGKGVREIRIHYENEYRVIYVASFEEAIYVLHTFVKKTQKTSKKDIDLARERYKTI